MPTFRFSLTLVLLGFQAISTLGGLASAAPRCAPKTLPCAPLVGGAHDWRNDLEWHTDFQQASAKAQESNKTVLAYIPKFAKANQSANNRDWEQRVLGDTRFMKMAKRYVLYIHDAKGSKKELPLGARAIECTLQSVIILDADGWALARIEVEQGARSGQLPTSSQVKSLESDAKAMLRTRQKANKGQGSSKMKWLSWTAGSGQERSLKAATSVFEEAKERRKSKRKPIEVAVILNMPIKKLERGKLLWPYFVSGVRPADTTKDWKYLWALVKFAEQQGDHRGFKKVQDQLKKKGVCQKSRRDLDATYAKLKKRR